MVGTSETGLFAGLGKGRDLLGHCQCLIPRRAEELTKVDQEDL